MINEHRKISKDSRRELGEFWVTINFSNLEFKVDATT